MARTVRAIATLTQPDYRHAPLIRPGRHSPGCEVLRFALAPNAVRKIASLEQPVHVVRGQAVYRAGQSAEALFRLHSGTCKSVTLRPDGLEQVTGYHLVGDVVGCGGIANHAYPDDVVALELCELRRISYAQLSCLSRDFPRLHRNIMCLQSMEVQWSLNSIVLLSRPGAEGRICRFLLDLSRRHVERGQSAVDFGVQLSLGEIGSLLGLADETVCRALTRMQADGMLQREGRRFELLDLAALRLRAGIADSY